VYAAASRSDFVAAAYDSFGPKLTQTMTQTHLKKHSTSAATGLGIMWIVTAKDTLITDIRICTTIMASANRAANNSKH